MKARTVFCALAATMMLFVGCEKDPQPNNPSGGGNDDPQQEGAFDQNGATYSTFSIGEGQQVRFSRGNLQYKASTNTWRFAEHQWDVVGETNSNLSATYDGWIDLFGWGTSGWNSGAPCYHPWDQTEECSDFWVGGDYNNDLTGNYANADWGVYNAISNGGNRAGMWRTLTADEWGYLISREDKTGYGLIDRTHMGLIVLPDNWQLPDSLTFVPNNNEYDQDHPSVANEYTLEEWAQMEAAGALFLPITGRRQFMDFCYLDVCGNYWSSIAVHQGYPEEFALYLRFDWVQYANPPHIDGAWRQYGFAVRLVRAE